MDWTWAVGNVLLGILMLLAGVAENAAAGPDGSAVLGWALIVGGVVFLVGGIVHVARCARPRKAAERAPEVTTAEDEADGSAAGDAIDDGPIDGDAGGSQR